MIFPARLCDLKALVALSLQVYLCCLSCDGQEQNASQVSQPPSPDSTSTGSGCALYKYVGVNDLSVNDIVVKSETGDLVCIKAQFSLAIKVETEEENTLIAEPSDHRPGSPSEHQHGLGPRSGDNEGSASKHPENKRLVLGYLPLDSVISVKDTCPSPKTPASPPKENLGSRLLLNEPKELEMVVSFECGKLAFTFRQEEKFYLSAIQGLVNLDSSTVREFVSEKQMFFTSDLGHHFKSTELIEVNSIAKSKAFILTANFYHLEFETFRNTSSRAFIRPPDGEAKSR